MAYLTNITKKGQITIPKSIRDALEMRETDKFFIEVSEKERLIKIRPVEDFLQVAKKIKVRRKINPLKTRELMEKFYERK